MWLCKRKMPSLELSGGEENASALVQCRDAISSAILATAGSPVLQKAEAQWEQVQGGGTMIIQGTASLSCERRMEETGLFSLGTKRLGGNRTSPNKYREEGAEVLKLKDKAGARTNWHK